MMVVYWATKLRGFLRHISEYSSDVRFEQKNQYYETSNKLHILKSKLIRSRILDPVGLFQIIPISGKDCDAYGSYNRFLKADRPYFIYLENPTALYHYALGRLKFPLGKKRFQKCLEDPNLKYIVCMSEACRSTFEKINMPLPEHVRMKTIYPLVPQNKHVNEDVIRKKCYDEVLECLYCVQGKRFYTKGGRDVLNVVAKLQDEGYKIHLTVITNLDALDGDTVKLMRAHDNISLHEFAFSYQEMEEIYAKTALLLQPSSDDSFGLTVLEAMKAGEAVLGSRLYAIPEMVSESKNGILIDPAYWMFTRDNISNPKAWGHRKKVRLCKETPPQYIENIESAIKCFYTDRDTLYQYAKKSWEISNTKFGEKEICDRWEHVWNSLKGQ